MLSATISLSVLLWQNSSICKAATHYRLVIITKGFDIQLSVLFISRQLAETEIGICQELIFRYHLYSKYRPGIKLLKLMVRLSKNKTKFSISFGTVASFRKQKTVQTQIMYCKRQHLIRVYTDRQTEQIV